MDTKIAALILIDHSRFLGMDLTERAAAIARRAGIQRLYFSGRPAQIKELVATVNTLVVLDARTIVEPKGVREAVARAGEGVVDLTAEGAIAGRFSRRIDN